MRLLASVVERCSHCTGCILVEKGVDGVRRCDVEAQVIYRLLRLVGLPGVELVGHSARVDHNAGLCVFL